MNDSQVRKQSNSKWIVSPTFDILFFINITWLIYLIPGISTRNETAIDFWQIYFVTLPHRWITILVVLADPDRRSNQERKLATVAVLTGLLVGGSYVISGDFWCLAVIDFLWNAWHFASQHSGIFAIYGKKTNSPTSSFEKYSFRVFIAYSILSTPGWTEGYGWNQNALLLTDAAIFSIPIFMITKAALEINRQTTGRIFYLLSVSGLYIGMLVSARQHAGKWILVFSSASALFHATEYLAVITHYSLNRRNVGSRGFYAKIAGSWLSSLAIFVVIMGWMGFSFDSRNSSFYEVWIGLNLWAAFTHYAFDGLIWRLRDASTSRALGVNLRDEKPA